MFLADFLYKSHKSSEAGLFLTSFLWSAALRATESHIYTPNESHEKSTAFDFGWVKKEGVLSLDTMVTKSDVATEFLCLVCFTLWGCVCFRFGLSECPCNVVCMEL